MMGGVVGNRGDVWGEVRGLERGWVVGLGGVL